MRAAYHSEYRPGAADTSELDPCIAAETRLKKSAFSTSKKRTLCLVAILALIFILFIALLIVFVTSSGKSETHSIGDVDYESLEAPQFDLGVDPTTTTKATVATSSTVPNLLPTTTSATTRSSTRMTTTASTTRSTTTTTTRTTRPPARKMNVETVENEPPTTTVVTTTRATRPPIPTRDASLALEMPYKRLTEVVRESCMDHASSGFGSGVYRIAPDAEGPFDVYCMADEDDRVEKRHGGAWTVMQRMDSDHVSFYNRSYEEYERGFGRVDQAHWLGLQYVHRLAPATTTLRATLRIELHGDYCFTKGCSDLHDKGFWWGEWDFGISDASDKYRLHVSIPDRGNLSVHTAHDVLYSENNLQQFTAINNDNDKSESNCAQFRNLGGWWHKDCTYVALNGMYGDTSSKLRYQLWHRSTIPGDPRSYVIHPKKSIMMIRPKE